VTAPTGVTVSPSSATVSAGSTKQLSATVSPSGAPQGVTWSSGNTSIATVNSSGLVSAVSPDTVTITASSSANSSKKGTCIISVNPVSISYVPVSAGNTYSLSLSAGQHRWYKFTPTESRAYTFTTTGSTDTYGELHQGSTVLTADDNSGDGNNFLIVRPLTAGTQYYIKIRGATTSVTGNCVLSVDAAQIAPTGVTVSPASTTVSAGSTKQLSATVSPAGALQSVTWSSGNTSIATVNSSGLVSAVSPGTVTITATSTANPSIKGTATVTVVPGSHSYATISFGDNLYFESSDSPLTAGQHRWYKFTPTESRKYVFTSTGTLDTVGELYQGDTLLASNDDGGAGNNFLIERDLTANTEYRLKVCGADTSVSGSIHLGVYRYFTASVNNYYDHGYHVRYGEIENSAKAKINGYTDEISARFLQTVGLRLLRNDATYFNSAIDQCKGTVTACSNCIANVNGHTSADCNINLLCSHEGDKCTDSSSMHEDFRSNVGSGSDTVTNTFWTGHRVISVNGAGRNR